MPESVLRKAVDVTSTDPLAGTIRGWPSDTVAEVPDDGVSAPGADNAREQVSERRPKPV